MKMKSNSDRISNLSTDLTDIILSKLPIKEAARTSILSKKWRSNWLSLPILTMDDSGITTEQFLDAVNQILLQRSGSIRVFTLNVSEIESCMDIEHWIWYLSMKGLTEFTLKLWTQSQGHYQTYCELSSGFYYFHSLVTLKLRVCHIVVPVAFPGLKSLIRLELDDVSFEDDGQIILLQRCPLLKYLRMHSRRECDLIIWAPKLESFVFEGCLEDSLCLSSKSLVHVSICMEEPPQSLPRGHVFLVRGDYIMILWEALEDEPCILSNIQHLHLENFNIQDSIERSSAVNLITNSPNLDKLSISVDEESSKRVGKLSDVEKTSFSASKLKTVEIEEFSGLSCEMEFVELLLSKSPVLESIVIKASKSVSNCNSHKMLKKLTRFRRAAPYAELIFLDSEDK